MNRRGGLCGPMCAHDVDRLFISYFLRQLLFQSSFECFLLVPPHLLFDLALCRLLAPSSRLSEPWKAFLDFSSIFLVLQALSRAGFSNDK